MVIEKLGAISWLKDTDNGWDCLALKLINRTGAASTIGTAVQLNPSYEDSVYLSNNDDTTMGVVYSNGVSNGSDIWIGVIGFMRVLLKDGEEALRGITVTNSSTPGRLKGSIYVNNPYIYSLTFGLKGFFTDNVSSGTSVLAPIFVTR